MKKGFDYMASFLERVSAGGPGSGRHSEGGSKRYDIHPEHKGDYRNTVIDEKVDNLDPDGFEADEKTGDKILKDHGWTADKSEPEKSGD